MENEFLKITEEGNKDIDLKDVTENLYSNFHFNSVVKELATRYRVNGPCNGIPTGCAAGLDAMGFAFDQIRRGDCDVMITGGSEAPITPITFAAFDVIGTLSSKRNDDPKKASRPFDNDRDGFVLGEGACIYIFEEYEHAVNRGADIIAEVKGFGSTCNAFHMTNLPEGGDDLARAIDLALKDAEIKPGEVDYISAHGSSTRQNDVNETGAYKKVFGDYAYNIPISSLKGMCGHALAAANSIESGAACMSIKTKSLHATLNQEVADPNCDLDYIPNTSRSNQKVDVVLKNSSGFSGIHSAMVFTDVNYKGMNYE